MKNYRLVKIIFVFLMYSLVVVGCGKKVDSNESNKNNVESDLQRGWEANSDEKIELDWYINFSWYTTPWGGNIVSKAITEETGVDINFIVPGGSEIEKLNSMIASDTLPDLITLGWWETPIQEMINNDMVYALNELAEEYDPYFFNIVDDQVVSWYSEPDGNLYCYPNSSYSPDDFKENVNIGSNQNFIVRKDIYEAIGSPDMTTPAGFSDAVKKATEMFPKVNGQPLIPIGSDEFMSNGCNSFDKYLLNFLAIPYEKDGAYYDRYTDSDYIQWLKTFRQLNEEGYLADEIFIDKRIQLEEKMSEGRYFCLLYQGSDIQAAQKALYENNPNSIYIAVEGPRNSNGDDPVLPSTGINGWTVTLISKNCENPDRAIQFLTYLISEQGQKMVYLGVEGVTYDIIDNEYVLRKDVLDLLNTNREQFDEIYGSDDAYWMMQNNIMQSQWGINNTDSLLLLKEWTYPYTAYTGQYDVIFETGTDISYADLRIKEVWGSTLPQLLLAPSEKEFDEILHQFILKRDELGYDAILEEATKQMKESKIILGME